jgi:hypothetical protein
MLCKDVLGHIATLLTFISFAPYLIGALTGKVRPHLFSWVIWSLSTLVVFAAQWQAHGGAGVWSIGWGGVLTVIIAGIAFVKKSDLSRHISDWIFFIVALLSIPLWYFTADPLLSVILLTVIDLLGFGPTLRNAWQNPHQEQITFYALYVVRNLFSFAALESYSITTWLFPVVIGAACLPLIGVILWRRLVLAKGKAGLT